MPVCRYALRQRARRALRYARRYQRRRVGMSSRVAATAPRQHSMSTRHARREVPRLQAYAYIRRNPAGGCLFFSAPSYIRPCPQCVCRESRCCAAKNALARQWHRALSSHTGTLRRARGLYGAQNAAGQLMRRVRQYTPGTIYGYSVACGRKQASVEECARYTCRRAENAGYR